MTYIEKLNFVSEYRNIGKNAERIVSQITYLDSISKCKGGKYNCLLEKALDFIIAQIEKDGAITTATVTEAENMLMELAPIAKGYKQLFLSHAHIDMNWMWGYNETVAVTIDTFRTILNLMAEYPEFTYGQSQASTYEIIEKFAPEMIDEIKQYIREGRWEVNACEWVEPDKNMPDGESLTRQILQTKKYLSKLLDIPYDYMCVDFVPDTFGHNLNVPEILSNAGVKYMYHCRGYEDYNIYRYQSPSGKNVLVYREYCWYNDKIQPANFEIVPQFCEENGINTFMSVYGVGDHGGGPSRRDIERIIEYKSWPLTPDIQFGTLRQFFSYLENCGKEFPVVDKELNFILCGCYTTQSRIKMANRIGEARINEVEQLSAAASVFADAKKESSRLDRAWRNILFNHFHDIIPGSGTIETREYAMGLFQDALAYVNSYANSSMRAIAEKIDTSSIPFAEDIHTSEGAGVGYYQDQVGSFRFPAVERGAGPVRALHIFNTTEYDRDEFTEVTMWDYKYNTKNLAVSDAEGNALQFCVKEEGKAYWDHEFTKLLVKVKVKAFGYTTIIVSQNAENRIPNYAFFSPKEYGDLQPRIDNYINDEPCVLENEYIKAVFDKETLTLISLTDKQSGEELISEPAGYFKYIEENPLYGMIAWRVGPYMKTVNLNKEYAVKMEEPIENDAYSKLSYTIEFNRSKVCTAIILKKNSHVLEFETTIDWQELPVREKMIPQLSFVVPVSYTTDDKAVYDIPYGEIEREPMAMDVPALSYLNMRSKNGNSVGIVTDTKYGYRYWNNCGSVDLVRNAYDPDPYSDSGIHNIRIGIMVADSKDMKELSSIFNHPLCFTPATKHEGTLPLSNSLLDIKGDVKVSCVKNSEDNKGIAVRVYDVSGKKQNVTFGFAKAVTKAYITDSNEKIIAEATVSDGEAMFDVMPYSVVTVVVNFD